MPIVRRFGSAASALGTAKVAGSMIGRAEADQQDRAQLERAMLTGLNVGAQAAAQKAEQAFRSAEAEKARAFSREMNDNETDRRWSEMQSEQRFRQEQNDADRRQRDAEVAANRADQNEYRRGVLANQRTNAYANLARGGASVLSQARGFVNDAAKRAEAVAEAQRSQDALKAMGKVIEGRAKQANRPLSYPEELAIGHLATGKPLPEGMLNRISDLDPATGAPKRPASALTEKDDARQGWLQLPDVNARFMQELATPPTPMLDKTNQPMLDQAGQPIMEPAKVSESARKVADSLAQVLNSTETKADQLKAIAASMGRYGLPPEMVQPVRDAYAQREVGERIATLASVNSEASAMVQDLVQKAGPMIGEAQLPMIEDRVLDAVLKRHGFTRENYIEWMNAQTDPQGTAMQLAAPPAPPPKTQAAPVQESGPKWWEKLGFGMMNM